MVGYLLRWHTEYFLTKPGGAFHLLLSIFLKIGFLHYKTLFACSHTTLNPFPVIWPYRAPYSYTSPQLALYLQQTNTFFIFWSNKQTSSLPVPSILDQRCHFWLKCCSVRIKKFRSGHLLNFCHFYRIRSTVLLSNYLGEFLISFSLRPPYQWYVFFLIKQWCKPGWFVPKFLLIFNWFNSFSRICRVIICSSKVSSDCILLLLYWAAPPKS